MDLVKKFSITDINRGKIENLFFCCSIFLIILSFFVFNDSKFALVSALCGVTYTVFAGKGKAFCYLIGMVGTLCYSYLSYKNSLFGNLALYLGYYFPMEIIGFFLWNKNLKKDKKVIQKISLNSNQRLLITFITLILITICSFLLNSLGDKYFLLDSIITVLSITGMYLTVKRAIEQWIVWTLVNSLSVFLWFLIYIDGGRSFTTLLMWSIYLIIGVYYYFVWAKELKN